MSVNPIGIEKYKVDKVISYPNGQLINLNSTLIMATNRNIPTR